MPLASVSTDPSFVDPTSTVAVDALAPAVVGLDALAEVAGLAPAEVETDFDPLLEQPATRRTPAAKTADPRPALRTNDDLVTNTFSLPAGGGRTPSLSVVRAGGPERLSDQISTADPTTKTTDAAYPGDWGDTVGSTGDEQTHPRPARACGGRRTAERQAAARRRPLKAQRADGAKKFR